MITSSDSKPTYDMYGKIDFNEHKLVSEIQGVFREFDKRKGDNITREKMEYVEEILKRIHYGNFKTNVNKFDILLMDDVSNEYYRANKNNVVEINNLLLSIHDSNKTMLPLYKKLNNVPNHKRDKTLMQKYMKLYNDKYKTVEIFNVKYIEFINKLKNEHNKEKVKIEERKEREREEKLKAKKAEEERIARKNKKLQYKIPSDLLPFGNSTDKIDFSK